MNLMTLNKKIKLFILLISLFILPQILFTDSPIPSRSAIEEEIVNLIQNKEFAKAISSIDSEIEKIKDKDYYTYLKANSYFNNNDLNKALEIYDQIIGNSESKWFSKSIFKKSEILEKQKKYDEAYKLSKDRLDNLLSDKRRLLLAKNYLDLATDISFQEDEKKNNYPKAIELLEKAVAYKLPDELGVDVDYKLALCYYFSNNLYQSQELLKKYIDKYKNSPKIGEATYYLGNIALKNYNYFDARVNFDKVLKDYPKTESAAKSLYDLAKTYRIPTPSNEDELELGVNALKQLVEKYQMDKLAPKAMYEIGLSYSIFSAQRQKAINELKTFVAQYPKDENAPYALKLVGELYFQALDYENGLNTFKQFLIDFPSHREWQNVQQNIINFKYNRAYTFVTDKKYDDAKTAFNDFMNEYPIDGRIPGIYYLLGEIESTNKNYDEAKNVWEKLSTKYPTYVEASKALYQIGLIYEEQKMDYENAIKTYEKVTQYPDYTTARARIEKLKSKEMTLISKKMFFSGDEPTIHVELRNIEKATINVYKINMEEYFRKVQNIKTIEDLDITLIQPDKTFEYLVPNYKKYELNKSDIPIKLSDDGAYVISTVTDTLISKTLTLVSNMGILVKTSKDKFLVFTKNLKGDESYSDVNVLISNKSKIILEGKTNKDGILEGDLKQITKDGDNIDNLVFFAYKDNHYTQANLSTYSLSHVTEENPIAYIYSDKPIYKPGDNFNFKAILRIIKDGVISQFNDKRYVVTFLSPDGRTIYEDTIETTDYGTLYGNFIIDPSIKSGWATLKIKTKEAEDKTDNEKDKPKVYEFTKAFEIGEYQRQESEISFETDKPAYMPREKVHVKFSGKHLFGLPASTKFIYYRIENDNWISKQLDANGETELDFETSKYGQVETINIQAYFEGKNEIFKKQIFFIIKDFNIELSSKRDLYLPQEEIPVDIITTTYDKKPIKKTLNVTLYDITPVSGIYREQKVETTSIITDDEGKATYKYTAQKGGMFKVIIEGIGENKIPVKQEIRVNVFDKDGTDKIAILADKTKFKINQNAEIVIHNSVDGGLALVTFEGDKIVKYQFVKLDKGNNKFEFTCLEDFVPDIKVSVNLLRPENFYSVGKIFDVESGLKINISTDKKQYKPNDKVELSINTQDINGKAVTSELSVALLDESMLLVTGIRLDDIKNYFFKKHPFNTLTQAGSSPYEYAGITEQRDINLIKESERRIRETSNGLAATSPAAPSPSSGPQQAYGGKAKTKNGKGYYKNQTKADSTTSYYSMDEKSVDYEGDSGGYANTEAKEYDKRAPMKKSSRFAGVKGGEEQSEMSGEAQARKDFPDVAFFKPDVITDKEGNAKISVPLPDSNTRWKIVVISNTKGALFGLGDATIVAKKDFFVTMNSPTKVTEGDSIKLEGEIFNSTENDKDGKVNVKLDGQEYSAEYKTPQGKSFSFKTDEFSIKDADLLLKTNTQYDTEEKKINVIKWGTEEYKGLSGHTNKSIKEFLNLSDKDENAKDKTLMIRIYPGINQVLKSIIDKYHSPCHMFTGYTSSMLLSQLMLFKYLDEHENELKGEIESLKKNIESRIMMLLSRANSNGAWSWVNYTYYSDIFSTCYAYYTLVTAKKMDFEVSTAKLAEIEKYLNSQYSSLQNEDYESKLLILWALSTNDKAEYPYVNRIYRNRNELSIRGLSLLTMILKTMNRDGEASDVSEILLKKVDKEDIFTPTQVKIEDNHYHVDFLSSSEEVQALVTLALLKSKGSNKVTEKSISNMLSFMNSSWHINYEFLGLFSQCISQQIAVKNVQNPDFHLTLSVNGNKIAKESFKSLVKEKEYIVKEGVTDKNTISFDIEGQGELYYDAYLSYFNTNEVQKAKTDYGRIEKRYEYPLYSKDGKNFSRGYYISKDEEPNSNPLEELNKGAQFPVNIKVKLDDKLREGYFILEDYIPSGCTLLETSIAGDYQHYRIDGNKIIFYVKQDFNTRQQKRSSYPPTEDNLDNRNSYNKSDSTMPIGNAEETPGSSDKITKTKLENSKKDKKANKSNKINKKAKIKKSKALPGASTVVEQKKIKDPDITISYTLITKYEGKYKVLPTKLYPIRQRYKVISSDALTLRVFDRTYETFKNYVFTPVELYEIGKYFFDKKDYVAAKEYLSNLDKNYKVKDEYYKELAKMFLYIAISENDTKAIIKNFELLKEHYPSLEIELTDVIKIAESYKNIGEYERGIYALKAIIDSYFFQESTLVATLEEFFKLKESYDYMERLIMEYPDSSNLKTSFYGMGQSIYTLFTQFKDYEDNPKVKQLKEKGITKDFLFAKSLSTFENYLVQYPTSQIADEVSFMLLNLHLDNEDYAKTIHLATVYSDRFKVSKYLDGYKYVGAYALFLNGKYDVAMGLSKSVAYDKFPGEDGKVSRESKNKHFAIHMLAKMYHYFKEYNKAFEEYEKVKDKFEDAKRSIEFLKEKKISVKDVTQIKDGEKPEVELEYKGIKEISLKIYKVDFLILALKEKNLSNITKINLAGIKPYFEKSYALQDDISYLLEKQKFELPIKEKGAYLLVFKHKEVEISGIVINSNLVVDAVEEVTPGRLRVSVVDEKKNFIKDAVTYFIGTANKEASRTKTDLRGQAEAVGIKGMPTVVGVKDNQYFYFRGTKPLGYYPQQPMEYQYDGQKPEEPAMNLPAKSLENIYQERAQIQQYNESNYRQNINKQKKSINVDELK